ncbi:hypothetical protein Tco_0578808, partial [Tanacetum coccineum]
CSEVGVWGDWRRRGSATRLGFLLRVGSRGMRWGSGPWERLGGGGRRERREIFCLEEALRLGRGQGGENHIRGTYANTNINANYNPYLDVPRTFDNHAGWNDEETIQEEKKPNDDHGIGNFDNDLVRDNTPYHANKEEEQYEEDRTNEDACHAYQEIFCIMDEGLEVDWIQRIQELDTAYWGFLGVGTMLDIFQNIILIPYLEYDVLILSRYDVLIFIPLWSLVSAGTDTPYLL